MTVVSASIVRSLKSLGGDELSQEARKLLTFVDNRQDASLQAGHFNDFVQVTQLRGGLFRAMGDEAQGLTHEAVAQRVTDALSLTMADFAANPLAQFSAQGPGISDREATPQAPSAWPPRRDRARCRGGQQWNGGYSCR